MQTRPVLSSFPLRNSPELVFTLLVRLPTIQCAILTRLQELSMREFTNSELRVRSCHLIVGFPVEVL